LGLFQGNIEIEAKYYSYRVPVFGLDIFTTARVRWTYFLRNSQKHDFFFLIIFFFSRIPIVIDVRNSSPKTRSEKNEFFPFNPVFLYKSPTPWDCSIAMSNIWSRRRIFTKIEHNIGLKKKIINAILCRSSKIII